jgi:ABC-type glutathione transport system ATPase component
VTSHDRDGPGQAVATAADVPVRIDAPACPATTAVLAAWRVEKSYRRGVWPWRRTRCVLRGVDVALYPGEVVGLVGENGSGKATFDEDPRRCVGCGRRRHPPPRAAWLLPAAVAGV